MSRPSQLIVVSTHTVRKVWRSSIRTVFGPTRCGRAFGRKIFKKAWRDNEKARSAETNFREFAAERFDRSYWTRMERAAVQGLSIGPSFVNISSKSATSWLFLADASVTLPDFWKTWLPLRVVWLLPSCQWADAAVCRPPLGSGAAPTPIGADRWDCDHTARIGTRPFETMPNHGPSVPLLWPGTSKYRPERSSSLMNASHQVARAVSYLQFAVQSNVFGTDATHGRVAGWQRRQRQRSPPPLNPQRFQQGTQRNARIHHLLPHLMMKRIVAFGEWQVMLRIATRVHQCRGRQHGADAVAATFRR